ncbi:MAG: right-handed parallel beta-helix repeat-containing protein [Kiritimatiellae bacterium]|jgi:hypothetical protein|nr:right-handed parallel beta-helix repeat-containing protein [Kiritimatiellia bacterium]
MMKRMMIVGLVMAVICGCRSWHVETPSMALQPTLYVAPDGNDQRDGSRKQPLATLQGARNYLRKHRAELQGAIVVEFAGGIYRFKEPVVFGKDDGGTADQQVVYRAAEGAEVRFSGAVPVKNWQPVTDKDMLARLPEVSRSKVMVADLRKQGITDYGKLTPRGFGKSSQLAEAELLYDRVPMSLSRWPKTGWMKISAVDEKKEYVKVSTDGRLSRWVGEKDPWLFAYWHVDWAEAYEPLAGVDVAGERLKRDVKCTPYSDKITPKNVRWYALNLFSELELPCEYYLDRADGKIYFIPPCVDGDAELTMASGLIKASDCSYMRFEGITFEGVRGRALHLSNVTNCGIVGCTIRTAAFNAISMSGMRNEVYGCDIFDTGAGGINVSGGDRKKLISGHCNVENNHVHHYSRRARTYKTGITISGCGNRMAHNLVHHGPHMALSAPGNNHIVEFNEIHNAVHESGDAGAYYVGRDWTQRGNILRYNYWHHIKGSSSYGGMTIYLDDQHCGHTIFGNVFERCNQSVFIGGGDDNKVLNNVFIDSYKSAHLDNRGMGWQKAFTDNTNSSIHKQLHSMPYSSKLWAKAYPELVNVLDDDPGVPKRNVFARNVSCGGQWDAISKKIVHLQTVTNNIVFNDDKAWVTLTKDEQGRPVELSFKDPDAVKKIGFEPIPVQKMGLYKDPRRASWPFVREIEEVKLPHEKDN